jgi:hypothetical protein
VQALATLLLVLTTAGSTVEVPLQARLDVRHRRVVPVGRPAAGSLAARYPAGWIVIDSDVLNSASARRGGPTWTADVGFVAATDGAGVHVTVTMTYLADVRVEREVLELGLPADEVRAVWRDGQLRAVPVGTVLRIDRWTPRQAALRTRGARLLLDGSDAEGLELRREPGRVVLRLELDEAADHPFAVEGGCRSRWRGAGKGVDESARLRLAGEKVTYSAYLHAGEVPLIVDRLAQGRRAALVFSDHADQSTAPTLRALLDGNGGHGGFLGHGLPLTKALFWRNEPGREQLESAEVRGLAARLRAGGGEIALHSATPAPDPRALTETAFRELRDLEVRTWIDHQPATNCEAFTNRGWWPDRDQGIVDLLAAGGVRYVWVARGEPKPKDHFNLLRPSEPARRTPIFYPWAPPTREGRAAGFYLFRSAWAYVERDRFFAMLSPARLDRLTEERGVAILHTYLEAVRMERRLRPRNVLLRDAGTGAVTLDPRLEALLADLARRQQAGLLWVTTVRDLGDHLRGLAEIGVRYEADGSARIWNRGPAAVRGATLRLPVPGGRLQASRPAAGSRSDADGPVLWLDLAPGTEARVTASQPFVTPLRVRFKVKP